MSADNLLSGKARSIIEHGILRYQVGFGNHFATEALPGALPEQNSPQRCPYGLYAEQFSGTSFTARRVSNRRSWLYRIRPAVTHGPFERIDNRNFTSDFSKAVTAPDQLRWSPMSIPRDPTDFIEGLFRRFCTTAGYWRHDRRPHYFLSRRGAGEPAPVIKTT